MFRLGTKKFAYLPEEIQVPRCKSQSRQDIVPIEDLLEVRIPTTIEASLLGT